MGKLLWPVWYSQITDTMSIKHLEYMPVRQHSITTITTTTATVKTTTATNNITCFLRQYKIINHALAFEKIS